MCEHCKKAFYSVYDIFVWCLYIGYGDDDILAALSTSTWADNESILDDEIK